MFQQQRRFIIKVFSSGSNSDHREEEGEKQRKSKHTLKIKQNKASGKKILQNDEENQNLK